MHLAYEVPVCQSGRVRRAIPGRTRSESGVRTSGKPSTQAQRAGTRQWLRVGKRSSRPLPGLTRQDMQPGGQVQTTER